MIEFYPHIKLVHVTCALLSVALFTLRGGLMFSGSPAANAAPLRYLSYAIDTTLLTAAFMLMTLLHVYPIAVAWLTVKVILIVVYVALGVVALRRGRSRRTRTIAFAAALAVFAFVVSIARAHHPLGGFATVLS
ncbi:MAG TPA: SirB2 family protein [Tahibacter sp.]|uniref:SirB2 family protein n=1 Tax=Tahibacter sp. TaxID=2056211 RepID=UPI002C08E5A0|nr:SirB2 family protein [Tahibacter sp.]HSX61417.1 SirB2 family protein [Tahibacter sp.]